MKIETTRKELLPAVQAVLRAVPRKSTLPILACILIDAGPETTRFEATDLNIALTTTRPIAAKTAGAYAIPAHRLRDILNALPDDATVTLAVEPNPNLAEGGGRATLRSGRSRFVMSAIAGADFPVAKGILEDASITVAHRELRTAFNRTAYAMAKGDVRYYLNGVMLEVCAGNMRLVATDGHRMAVNDLPGAEHNVGPSSTLEIIFPDDAVDAIRKLLTESDDPVKLVISRDGVLADFGDTQLRTTLVQGKFPDYRRVIPRSSDKVVLADSALLRNMLTRCKLMLSDKSQGISLSFEPWVLKAAAKNSDQEEAEDDIEVNYDGASIQIGFNAFYLLDALTGVDSATVKLSLQDAGSSILLESADGSSGLHVIMPMRI